MFGRAISNRSRGPLPRTMFGAGQLRAFTARWRVAIDPRPRTGPRGPRCHRTHRRASCANPRGLRGPASLESILSEVGPDLAPGKIRVRGGRHGLGKRPFCGFRGKNYPLLRQSTLVMEWMVQIWNNPKRLDHLAATWMLAWFLIWLAPWLPGFRIPLFDGSPQNMFGGLERGLLYAVGFAPFFVLELRRRRILRSARA